MSVVIKSLASDQLVNDTIASNKPYNYKDYMCVFENASYEIPPEYLGMLYTMSENFDFRKKICETTTLNAGAEGGMYIKTTDWIDPTKDIVCGIFDLNSNRLKTEKDDKRQFPSKRLCDMYNTPRPDPTNLNNLIISKLVPQEIINPVTDYNKIDQITDDKNSLPMRDNYMISMITMSAILYLFYVIRYQVNRPYQIYDITKKLFINRIFWVLILFGLFIYVFCPYGTCYFMKTTPNLFKHPDSETFNRLCDNLQNFRGKRVNEVLNLCDILLNYYGNSFDKCNEILDSINNNRSTYYSIYKEVQSCYGCLVPNSCIRRPSNHFINIYKRSDGSYYKMCKLCNEIFCNGNKCYPGKDSYYSDKCPSNNIVEHEMKATSFNKDSVTMTCTYCLQTCKITN
jgi:hypothetical protein